MTDNTSFALRVLNDRCTGCGLCADTCAYHAIRFTDYPEIDPYACRLCGSCVQACPAEALEMAEPENAHPAASSGQSSKGIWVLAEVENNELTSVTKELLGKAVELSAKLNQDVEAVLVGHEVGSLAPCLIAYGANRVHVVENELFASFIEENYARAVVELVGKHNPEILLVGATLRGRGLSARIASLLQTGLTADCTELDIDPATGLLHQIRPAFGGNLMATIVTPGRRPQMASVRPGIMKAIAPDDSVKGEIIHHDFSTFRGDNRIRMISEMVETISEEALGNSRIIIGVGRGVKNRETVAQIRRWAERLGAVVAGSRAAVEAGLIDVRMQVGQTGHTISPDLYIAIGISGQIQHTAAITGAKKVIAINPDRTAPIFNVADYGWVASVEEALPQLTNGCL